MNNKFLDAYRNLENELRAENKTVLEYENSLQDTNIQEKLKLCRITRNYLSHQDTKFASVNKEMVEFLDKLAKEINLKAHTVKDEMKKIKPIFLNENIKNIIPMCAKYKYVPIVDKKTNQLIHIIDSEFLVEQLAKNNKKIVLPKKREKYNYIDKNSRLDKLSGLYIVTIDGTEKSKYIGILEV